MFAFLFRHVFLWSLAYERNLLYDILGSHRGDGNMMLCNLVDSYGHFGIILLPSSGLKSKPSVVLI
jgi:hypothetical protein